MGAAGLGDVSLKLQGNVQTLELCKMEKPFPLILAPLPAGLSLLR